MKKATLGIGILVLFILYAVVLKHRSSDSEVVVGPPHLATATPTASPSPTSISSTDSNSVVTTPLPTATPSGKYKDGSYTGSAEDAYYGTVQVRAVISSGKISDVQFLSYPNDRSTSQEINSQATVYLKEEAIQAQSADVDTISGATLTSEAFNRSLADALQQAE